MISNMDDKQTLVFHEKRFQLEWVDGNADILSHPGP